MKSEAAQDKVAELRNRLKEMKAKRATTKEMLEAREEVTAK